MATRLSIAVIVSLLSLTGAHAQSTPPSPSPEAMAAARTLVTDMKLGEQYKTLLPAILLGLRPVITQERPEIDRDFYAVMPTIVSSFAPYIDTMIDAAAKIYASNFTLDELKQIDAFYRTPTGQKLLEKMPTISQQSMQIGQEVGRKAAEDLRGKLVEALREKGHKL